MILQKVEYPIGVIFAPFIILIHNTTIYCQLTEKILFHWSHLDNNNKVNKPMIHCCQLKYNNNLYCCHFHCQSYSLYHNAFHGETYKKREPNKLHQWFVPSGTKYITTNISTCNKLNYWLKFNLVNIILNTIIVYGHVNKVLVTRTILF